MHHISSRFRASARTALPRLALLLIVLALAASSTCRLALAQTASAEIWVVNGGEVRWDGRIQKVDAATGTFMMCVTSMTPSSGQTRWLEPPQERTVVLGAKDALYLRHPGPQVATLAQLPLGALAIIIGQESSDESSLTARVAAVWNRPRPGAGASESGPASLDSWPLEDGEIRLDGRVVALNSARTALVLTATSFTLPSGRTRAFSSARRKTVTLGAGTLIHVRGDTRQSIQSREIRIGTRAIVIGDDLGNGQNVPARRVLVWDTMRTGAYRLEQRQTQEKPTGGPSPVDEGLLAESRALRAKLEPKTGCYLGAYVLDDPNVCHSIAEWNRMAGRRHASFFKYLQYGDPFPSAWVAELKAEGAFPQIAWEPQVGLNAVVESAYLKQFARDAGASGVPIFLRWASEVNGPWVPWHGNPRLYKQKWVLIHDVMQRYAPNVAMLWTVFTMPQESIASYYPGDRYVDWVGVNIYNVVYHDNDRRRRAMHEDPLQLLSFVYKTYARHKPIQISEYGASNQNITDGKSYPNYASAKLERLYSNLKQWPRVKAVFYFDVNTLQHNYNPRRSINNYALTSNPRVLTTYRRLIQDKYFIGAERLPF